MSLPNTPRNFLPSPSMPNIPSKARSSGNKISVLNAFDSILHFEAEFGSAEPHLGHQQEHNRNQSSAPLLITPKVPSTPWITEGFSSSPRQDQQPLQLQEKKSISSSTPRMLVKEELRNHQDYASLLDTEPGARTAADLEHLANIMSCSHVLRPLSHHARCLLARTVKAAVVEPGTRIFSKGEESSCGYVVLHGEVLLILPDPDDPENSNTVLSKVTAGHSFGDLALARPDEERRSHAVCVGDDVALLMRVGEREFGLVRACVEAQRIFSACLCEERGEDDVELLATCVIDELDCLRHLSSDGVSRSALAHVLKAHRYAANSVVYYEGEMPEAMYVSLSAHVGFLSREPSPNDAFTRRVSSSAHTLPHPHASFASSHHSVSHRNMAHALGQGSFLQRLPSTTTSSISRLASVGIGGVQGRHDADGHHHGHHHGHHRVSRASSTASYAEPHHVSPGGYFGERSVIREKLAISTATVLRPGILLSLSAASYRSILLAQHTRALERLSSVLRIPLHLGDDVPTDTLVKFVQCCTETTYPPNTVLGRQGDSVESFYFTVSGACEARVSLRVVSKRRHGGRGGRGEGDEGGNEPGPMSMLENKGRREVVVARHTANECVGLVDVFGGGSVWTATYTTSQETTVLSAPVQRIIHLIKTMPSCFRELQDLSSTAASVRGSSLGAFMSVLENDGLRLVAGQQIVLDRVRGQVPMARDLLAEMMEEQGAASAHGASSSPTDATFGERKHVPHLYEDVFQDPKFKGSAIKLKRDRANQNKDKTADTHIEKVLAANRLKIGQDKLASLSVPLPKHKKPYDFKYDANTHFRENLQQGAKKYPVGCWLTPRAGQKDGWVDVSTINWERARAAQTNLSFATRAEAAVKHQRWLQSGGGQAAVNQGQQTTRFAKDVFNQLDAAHHHVALTPRTETELVLERALQSIPAMRHGGLKFLPRLGRRPNTSDFILPSTSREDLHLARKQQLTERLSNRTNVLQVGTIWEGDD